jgi:hypothetical protein
MAFASNSFALLSLIIEKGHSLILNRAVRPFCQLSDCEGGIGKHESRIEEGGQLTLIW